MNYYIADMHLGHENIIRLSKRPFKNVEEMNKILIDNWNNTITDNDNVYILGDMVFKSPNPTELVEQLNGNKYLIKGNHDKSVLAQCPYLFKGIYDYFEVNDSNKKIVLCHYPMAEWNESFKGALHFYGHIHNNHKNLTYKIMKDIPKAYNVGADIVGFTPRTADWIIKNVT